MDSRKLQALKAARTAPRADRFKEPKPAAARCLHCNAKLPPAADGRSKRRRFCTDAHRAAWTRDQAKRRVEQLELALARLRARGA